MGSGSWIAAAVAAVAVAGLTCLVVGVAVYVGTTYAIRAMDRRGRGEALELIDARTRDAFLRTVLREIGSATFFTLLHPLGLIDPLPARGPGRSGRPVLLVHGYTQTRTNFVVLGPVLKAAGLGPLFTVNLRPWHASLSTHAATLDRRIEEISSATGAQEIDIVAHSMGGVVARLARALPSGHRIRRIVTLGTPHRGTLLGLIALNAAGWEMAPGSPVLSGLPAESPDSLVSISSEHDAVVVPTENALIGPDGTDVIFRNVGHLSLLADSRVAEAVVRSLRDPPIART